MNESDKAQFLYGLASLEMLLRDELTDSHKDLYWTVMKAMCTIEEWEGACMLALREATFHAVPLPGIMQRYIHEVRREENKRLELRQKLAYQEQLQLESSAWRQEGLTKLEASQATLAEKWGEEWLETHKRMLASLNVTKEQN